jgi:hypothetical protein
LPELPRRGEFRCPIRSSPTAAGEPITAQGSGHILAGILRACGWFSVGRAGSKVPILSDQQPGALKINRRLVVKGWVVEEQYRMASSDWMTHRKIGALDAMVAIARTGDARVLFSFSAPPEDAS